MPPSTQLLVVSCRAVESVEKFSDSDSSVSETSDSDSRYPKLSPTPTLRLRLQSHSPAMELVDKFSDSDSDSSVSETSDSNSDSDSRNARNMPSEAALDEAIAHFLKEFPDKKKEIEVCIQGLRERAEEIDKTHKDCTIASVTASSASAVSGILSILGLTLAPVTAGGSLILTATGLGIGIASGVTSISAGVSERVIHSKEKKKSQELINECEESLSMVLSLKKIGFSSQLPPNDDANLEVAETTINAVLGVTEHIPKVVDQVTDIATHANAFVFAQANPAMKVLAKEASTLETVARNAIKGIDQVDEAFKGTALAASKTARVAGAVGSGLFLALDAYYIAKNAIDLSKGAKTETADELRAKAKKLEEIVQNLSKFYMELKEEWD